MPYKDAEKRKEANRKYRERKAGKEGKQVNAQSGQQRTIARCPQCPSKGAPCKQCYNAHRRTYRVKAAGFSPVLKAVKKKPGGKPHRHKIAVKAKPVSDFLTSDLFSCPGCMRKLRGEWRYCDRCEAKRSGV